uniref:Uncharacterized protein n=1 Tax=blood disease bacterium R229 TaxID=741978 RepID=G2ZQS2_9RALS|nr:hypothetical protein BDB_140002 [blood disease bacterium R229]
MLGPGHKQHGALEHIALDGFCLTESEEKALNCVACQNALKIVTTLLGVIEEPRPDGCRRMLGGRGIHCIALM